MTSDVTAGRHGGNPESAQANEAISRLKATMRNRVLEVIRARGADGMTVDEVEVALEMRHQTASARFTELKQLGLIEKTGDRRPTRSGHSAAVLRAVPWCAVCGQPATSIYNQRCNGPFTGWARTYSPCGHWTWAGPPTGVKR